MSPSRPTRLGLLVGVLLLVAISATAGYWFARRGGGTSPGTSSAQPASSETEAEGRKPLYWYDPMRPEQHFDKPGKSPFMDMQLVPRYAGGTDAGAVRVSPNATQNFGIRTGRVERAAIAAQLRAVGSVVFDERLLELVQARVEGSIVELHVKAPFERVHRGQRLAEILAPQWLEAEQQYVALLGTDEPSGALRAAARERLRVLGVPEPVVRDLERTRQVQPTTSLYAPIDGVVTELPARQGAAFGAGAALFRINGLKSVWVNAQIPEAQVSLVSKGSRIAAHASAWPGVNFKGHLVALLPDVDPQTRTLTARISIDNEGYRLAPGMYVTLEFAGAAGEPQLTVPSEAIIATGTRTVVIVQRPDWSFEVANVTLGLEQNGRTAVLSGLEEGDTIVLSGQFLIDSEASLNATVNRLQSSGAGAEPTASPPESRP